MQEQFVTYEIALKLKELEFNESCFGYYNPDKELIYGIDLKTMKYVHKYHKEDKSILAPLWQQVIDWFREKHKLYVNIEPNITETWQFSIFNLNGGLLFGHKLLFIQKGLNYKEVREQAILKAIELCKNNS